MDYHHVALSVSWPTQRENEATSRCRRWLFESRKQTIFSFSRRAKNIIVKNLVLLSWKKDFLKTRSTCFGTKDRRKEDWRSKVRKGIKTKRGHNKWNGPFPYHCCNYPASSDLTSPHGINIPIFFFFLFSNRFRSPSSVRQSTSERNYTSSRYQPLLPSSDRALPRNYIKLPWQLFVACKTSIRSSYVCGVRVYREGYAARGRRWSETGKRARTPVEKGREAE